MFFTQINSMMNQSVDITLVIRKKEGQLMVSTMPKSNGLKDEAQNHIVPLTVTGTPEELDMGFLPTICRPVQKAVGLLSNMSQFEHQADKAAANSKAAKELKDKEAKEAKEKKEKFDKHMKAAAEYESAQKYPEALVSLQHARGLSAPENLKSVDEKINAIKMRLSQGSLFGMELSEQPQQAAPVSTVQPPVQPMQQSPMGGHAMQNGQQPAYHGAQVQAQQNYNNYPIGGQPIPEAEPVLAMTTDYSVHREGEYDQYPDFPGYPNNMYNPQNI